MTCPFPRLPATCSSPCAAEPRVSRNFASELSQIEMGSCCRIAVCAAIIPPLRSIGGHECTLFQDDLQHLRFVCRLPFARPDARSPRIQPGEPGPAWFDHQGLAARRRRPERRRRHRLPHPLPLDRARRRADRRLRRHLHPAGRGARRRPQRDRLGASDERGGRGLRAVADARPRRHDLGPLRDDGARLCGGRHRLSRRSARPASTLISSG